MGYTAQKPLGKPAANTNMAQAGFAAHQLTNSMQEGETKDTTPDDKNVRIIQLTIPNAQVWNKGDVVYHPSNSATWIKWDGNPLPAGVTAQEGGVVLASGLGMAHVQIRGTYSAANFTNFATAQSYGIINSSCVAK
jgi:hypothetical protein